MNRVNCFRLILAGAVLASTAVHGVDVSGKVVDVDGSPVPYVRLRFAGTGAVPYSRSVFTDVDGSFSVHYEKATAAKLNIDVFRIGWRENKRKMSKSGDGLVIQLEMRRDANVADQVPPSAWLRGDPNSQAYQMTTLQCSNCHSWVRRASAISPSLLRINPSEIGRKPG